MAFSMSSHDSALKYRALTEISEVFLGSRDCDALFRGLWDALGKLVRFDFLLLMLIDEQTRSIRVETMAGAPPVDSPVGRNFPLEGAPSEVVWKSQKPLYVSDIEDETRFRPDVLRDMQRYQLRSGFWVPLTTVRRKLGSMVFASRYPGARRRFACRLWCRSRTMAAAFPKTSGRICSTRSCQPSTTAAASDSRSSPR